MFGNGLGEKKIKSVIISLTASWGFLSLFLIPAFGSHSNGLFSSWRFKKGEIYQAPCFYSIFFNKL